MLWRKEALSQDTELAVDELNEQQEPTGIQDRDDTRTCSKQV